MTQNIIKQREYRDRLRSSAKLFSQKIIGGQHWLKMNEMLDAISEHDNVCIKSGHSTSKSWTLARIGLWFLTCYSPSKVIVTAPTERQVLNIFWAEIESCYIKIQHLLGQHHMTLKRLEIAPDHYMLAFKSKDCNVNAFAGFHSPNVMVIMDEASGIAPDIWDGADGIKTGRVVKHIVASQPHDPTSRFAHCFKSPLWHKISISSFDSPNITGECQIPGLADMKWINDRKTDGWTEDSALWRVRILGEFPEGGVNALISLSDIQKAVERIRQPIDELVMGIDVARYGDDSTIFFVMDTEGVEVDVRELRKLDTMEIVGRAIEMINEYDIKLTGVDTIGLGAGVYDRLKEQLGEKKVISCNVATKSDPDAPFEWKVARRDSEIKLGNLRAELYWTLKNSMGILSLKDKGRLVEDLSDIRIKYRSDGTIFIEPKEDMKKRRSGVSPDYADALIIAIYTAGMIDKQTTKFTKDMVSMSPVSGLV